MTLSKQTFTLNAIITASMATMLLFSTSIHAKENITGDTKEGEQSTYSRRHHGVSPDESKSSQPQSQSQQTKSEGEPSVVDKQIAALSTTIANLKYENVQLKIELQKCSSKKVSTKKEKNPYQGKYDIHQPQQNQIPRESDSFSAQ